jgi:hypothetical protein
VCIIEKRITPGRSALLKHTHPARERVIIQGNGKSRSELHVACCAQGAKCGINTRRSAGQSYEKHFGLIILRAYNIKVDSPTVSNMGKSSLRFSACQCALQHVSDVTRGERLQQRHDAGPRLSCVFL